MRIVTAAEMQSMDRNTIKAFGIPGRVLMENAGRGATQCFLKRIYASGTGRVGVIAGRGNNGGDGFVIARYLAERHIEVEVFLLAAKNRVQGDAADNLHLLSALKVPVTEIPDAAAFSAHKQRMRHVRYWIDAIFGTGLNADVRGYYRDVIEFINSLHRAVLAVDIPSGLHADTGQPCGVCIQAAATATFGYAKIGHLVHPGAELCGTVDVIDIGIPEIMAETVAARQFMITGRTARQLLPRRPADSHKGHTGHILVIAASTGKTGAAAMAAMAALRVGAGLVTLGIPRSLNPVLESQVIEAMTLPLPDAGQGMLSADAFDTIARALQGKRCLTLGPGIGTAPTTRELVQRIVRESHLPMVIDADGLNNLAGHLALLASRTAPAVLTPHPGEMARLLETSTAEIQKDRPAAVRSLARQCKACVILKGARTLISDPEGRVWINTTGNAGMASGGMGDVLTGAVAGYLAQGAPAVDAAILAVFLHGLAADILAGSTPYGYLATDVMNTLPQAIRKVMDDPPAPPVSGPLL
ncbi:MAG: NAD(P)H-hydrate dehydratase [Desulfobacteraceae bacterium]|nr:MAG: NAD(P)H-hydrate dehydratase [Desulfobacteraceae bacterium]